MSRLLWFAFGALAACALAALGGFFTMKQARGLSAREEPMGVEAWVAGWARAAALPTDARSRTNPVPKSPEVLADARAHWADHCALCHANDGSGQIEMGQRLYPPAPDMRKERTQQMTDGELFYSIENGIRLSGMPAWGGTEVGERDSWKLVHFIRHLPAMSANEITEMEKLNPKSPEEQEEEKQEEEFLKGQPVNEAPKQHHHH